MLVCLLHGPMVKAIGSRLIDRGLESWPSHIFSFYSQKEQKFNRKCDELDGLNSANCPAKFNQERLEGKIRKCLFFMLTFPKIPVCKACPCVEPKYFLESHHHYNLKVVSFRILSKTGHSFPYGLPY